MWDSLFIPPAEWPALHQVLVEHCEDIGRNPSEITSLTHVKFTGGDDPKQLAEKAAAYGEAGVDLVVFSMFAPLTAASLEPLAVALQ
jgi:hypothetical protein